MKRRDYSRLWIFGHLMPYRTLYIEEEFVLVAQSENWPHVTGWQDWERVAWRIVFRRKFWRISLSPWRRSPQPLWLSHPWVRNPPFPNNAPDGKATA